MSFCWDDSNTCYFCPAANVVTFRVLQHLLKHVYYIMSYCCHNVKCFIKLIDIANKQSKQFKFVLLGYF